MYTKHKLKWQVLFSTQINISLSFSNPQCSAEFSSTTRMLREGEKTQLIDVTVHTSESYLMLHIKVKHKIICLEQLSSEIWINIDGGYHKKKSLILS